MKKEEIVTRNDIIEVLIKALKPLNYVHAFWEGGAIAFNRLDEWSDIDLYAVVDDDKVEETFNVIENALKTLSPIKQKLYIPQLPWPGISQTFYKLEKTSEFLIVDFAVIKLSAPDKLLETEIHGNLVFYFNKSKKLKPSRLDRNSFLEKLQARIEMLKVRFDLFNNLVEKEINRGNILEALEWYRAFTLSSLIEVLRMKYYPFHYNFRMRYIHYELPHEIVRELENLYFVKNEEDLKEKYVKATEWFIKEISGIDLKEIEKKLLKPK